MGQRTIPGPCLTQTCVAVGAGGAVPGGVAVNVAVDVWVGVGCGVSVGTGVAVGIVSGIAQPAIKKIATMNNKKLWRIMLDLIPK